MGIIRIPNSDLPLTILPGYGAEKVPRAEWEGRPFEDLMGSCVIWELPRAGHVYVIAADVGGGLGQDRSVAEVVRLGTITEPEEQVAEYVSDEIDPIDFAGVIDVMGRMYCDEQKTPALCAVEINNHGLTTQSELSRHLGYENFYIWQHEDAADPNNRYTRSVGFSTNRRTRPMLIQRFVKRINTVDKVSGVPDFKINSPILLEELRSFQTIGALYDAEAEAGSHDDAIFASAIAIYVCQTLQFESFETVADSRKRLEEERVRRERQEKFFGKGRDARNSEITFKEMMGVGDDDDDFSVYEGDD